MSDSVYNQKLLLRITALPAFYLNKVRTYFHIMRYRSNQVEDMRQHAVFHGGSLIGDKLDLVIASEVVGLVRFLLQTREKEWRDAVNQGLNEALCSPVLQVVDDVCSSFS